MKTLNSQKHLFDVPDDVAYFNCAYNAPQLNESRRRLHLGVDSKSHPWERTPESFFDDAEKIRHLASDLFEGESDGFAVIPAASYGVSTAARAIEPCLKVGDKILVLAEEFPSNVLPWKRTAKETGARITTIPTPLDGNWTDIILKFINADVKVLAVSSCHWTNGAYIDLMKISKACSVLDICLVIDASQTLGAIPFSIRDIQPDFLIAAGYKWLLCPYGFGLLYVSKRWRDSRPLEETWLTRKNAMNLPGLTNYQDSYLAGARRFDVGETCTATILPGAVAALEQIRDWGVENISDTLGQINNTIASHLEQLNFELAEESLRSPHMFGVIPPQHYNGNLVAELSTYNIHISQRGSALRISPHLHVSENDVGRLLDAFASAMARNTTR